MEHGLGQPLITIVFEQHINKSQSRIRWNDRAPFILLFKAPDQRARVGNRDFAALVIFEIERGQQWNLRLHTLFSVPVLTRVGNTRLAFKSVRNMSKTHNPQHLACVGRTRRAH